MRDNLFIHVKYYGFSLAAAALFAGCASKSTHTAGGSDAYNAAVDYAFLDLERRDPANRAPSATGEIAQMVGARFEGLRKAQSILVFPKVTKISEKASKKFKPMLSNPILYQTSTPRLLKCAQLAKDPAKEWKQQSFFKAVAQSNQMCAIVRYVQTNPKVLEANIRSGDIKEIRLYLTDDYRVLGTDVDIFVDKRSTRTESFGASGEKAVGSGLSYFPIDFPPSSAADLLKNEAAKIVDFSKDPWLSNKLKKWKVGMCTTSRYMEYRDLYSNRVSTYWCQGDTLPSMVENNRFVAFLRH